MANALFLVGAIVGIKNTLDKLSIRHIICPNTLITLKRTSKPRTAAREQDEIDESPARTMKPNGPRSCRTKDSHQICRVIWAGNRSRYPAESLRRPSVVQKG
jgi:hypothetical protein